MKYYKLTSCFYDSGRTEAFLESVELERQPRNTYYAGRNADVYTDYYISAEEAHENYKAVFEA